jgi:nicotinate-nucleotide adenylyltransferase
VRLGLLGGTFDPPHTGHLIAAQDALQALALDRVALIPAARPPHKHDRVVTHAEHRLAMLHLAADDDPRLAIEPLELERAGPSYTVDTLRALSARGDELFLLIGTDQFAEFDTWRDPAEIQRLAALGILRRAGDAASSITPATLEPWARIHDVPVTRIDVSSTLIRQAVAEGRSIRYLVPTAVAAYIDVHALYRADPETAAAAGGTLRDAHQSTYDGP